MNKVVLTTLLLAGLLCGHTADAAAPNATGIVSVGAGESGTRAQTGFVADDRGHIIARIQAPGQTLPVTDAAGATYRATAIAYDPVSRLSLLKVEADAANLKPYPFARDPAELQRKVFGIRVAQDPAQSRAVAGTLAGVQQPGADTRARSGYYLHNALVGEAGIGGPLFNNCGEVLGVIVPHPKFLARLLIDDEQSAAYAVPVEWIIGRFNTHGLRPARAADSCLSEAAQSAQAVATARAELEEQQRRAAEAAEAAAATQTELETAQSGLQQEQQRAAEAAQAAESAQAELDAVKQQLEQAQGAGEEERRRLQAEIEARENAVATARERETAARAEYETALLAAQQRETQYVKWGIIGGAALLLLLLLVWALKQRALARERRDKAAAESSAEQARASLAAREQDEARIRGTPTVFLDGTDAAGQAVALRIPGASIAAAGGTVVGRNPADSDFVINQPEVSRRQFRLFSDGRLLMLEDLGSTNGTTVDGKHLGAGQETALADRSRVQISNLQLSVRLEQGY